MSMLRYSMKEHMAVVRLYSISQNNTYSDPVKSGSTN